MKTEFVIESNQDLEQDISELMNFDWSCSSQPNVDININYKMIIKKYTDYWLLIKDIISDIFLNETNTASEYIKKNNIEELEYYDIHSILELVFEIANNVLKIMKVNKDEYFTNYKLIPVVEKQFLEKVVVDIWSWLWFWSFKHYFTWKYIFWLEYNQTFIDIANIIKSFLEEKLWYDLSRITFHKFDIFNSNFDTTKTYSIIWNPPFWIEFQKKLKPIVENAKSWFMILPEMFISKVFEAEPEYVYIHWKRKLVWFQSQKFVITLFEYVEDDKVFTWKVSNNAWLPIKFYKKHNDEILADIEYKNSLIKKDNDNNETLKLF